MTLPFYQPDKSWTLFLDRDGVINVKRDNDYVKKWDEFIFLEGALEAIEKLSAHFGRIIVVTNQRGVGRNLMSSSDVEQIHHNMVSDIKASGGRIDSIYYCGELAEEDHRGWRKPKPGMAFEAKKEFPEIDFAKSLIIGDSISDMEFGKNAGMYTLWISDKEQTKDQYALIDDQIESLYQFAGLLDKN